MILSSFVHTIQIIKGCSVLRIIIPLLLGLNLIQISLYTHVYAEKSPLQITSNFNPQLSSSLHDSPMSQIHEEPLPLYLSSRATLVIPQNASSDALAMGVGFGLADETGNFFGLRAIWIPDPPRDFLSSRSKEIKSAWGPVLEWHNLFSINGRLSFFSNVAGGFIYGTPQTNPSDQTQKSETREESTLEKNLLLPIIELGFGLRLTSRRVGDYRVFIAPELGYIFTGQSPYASLSIGVY